MDIDIYTLIDRSDLNSHDKASLKVLYRRYEKILKNMPLETQLHELIHYYRGDHYVKRDCPHCYIHNLIADYQVEKFISRHWSRSDIDRSIQLNRLSDQLHQLGLTGEYRDLLHWDCNRCPFKSLSNEGPKCITSISMSHRCTKLRYLLERLIKQMLPKIYVGITHRNYLSMQVQKKTKTIVPVKRYKKDELNIIVDTSTSIPLPIIQTVVETVYPFTCEPNVNLYGFSDICYKLTEDNIRYKDATHFQPVYEQTKDSKYNIVITDLQFDDFDLPLPKNYKVIEVGKVV